MNGSFVSEIRRWIVERDMVVLADSDGRDVDAPVADDIVQSVTLTL